MNKLDKDYQALLQDILDNGHQKGDRTGTGTISVYGRQFRHKMSEGFPLLTTKKMFFKGIVTELIWFLQGRTDLRYLLENGCHIWTGDAYKVYDKDFDREHPPFSAPYPKRLTQKEFEEKIMTDDEFNKWYGDLGPIYGKQWRSWKHASPKSQQEMLDENTNWPWKTTEIDQITNLINDLKNNPDSRRLMVTAWNPAELDQMTLPPCHYGFQVYTRELSWDERHELAETKYQLDDTDEELDKHNIPTRAISLMWNQRSVDTFLGLPFNIASYGLLLEIIAKEVDMVPEELIGNLGDVHIYSDHVEQVKEQIGKDLSDEERYNIWFTNNYETGMERHFDPNKLPDFNDTYYEPTPIRTREPYQLPTLNIKLHFNNEPSFVPEQWLTEDFEIQNYKSHPAIKAPLSN